MSKWEMYDELITAVPEDSVVSGCLVGCHWCLVRSEGTGLAMSPRETRGGFREAGHIAGRKTREIAGWIKSWNFHEAAIGLAAINSAINAPQVVEEKCGVELDHASGDDSFARMLDDLRGKKVAVVGHFRNLERVAAVSQLSILERIPEDGDLPDPACEYILPGQDFVFITATTLINKTLPRLLELSRGSRVIVAGPSTPLTPLLFKYGINMLGGLVVEEPECIWRVVQEGGQHGIFAAGSRMVQVENTNE